ncbi:hypothetical protein [Streptomyces sp. RKAG337]|uniref:hypothetical protein n=1 Tax=Streptomyces sp. RKAG337 TaxID=2893404 RepID=UPI002033B6AF|nr:hypothetical protein [Streptomyces sp. RKAG337]MCM2430962.1 hypothetical protein [Streptomyces sp. RKAG337]
MAIAVSAVAVLAACGSDGGTPKAKESPSPSTTSASPSPDASATAKEQVLAAYRGMWAEQTKIYNSGSFDGSKLGDYAADKALTKVKLAALYYQQNDLVVKGAPILSPKVTDLSLGTSPKTATIVDCVDSSKFIPENSKTGKKSELDGTNRRHVQTSKAFFGSGKWMIVDGTIDKNSKC